MLKLNTKNVLVRILLVTIGCFISGLSLSPVEAASFIQSNWTGGNGQTVFSDASKFSVSSRIETSNSNQITLGSNVGSGADGNCTITNIVSLNTASCVGRSNPDAVANSITTLISAGSTSVTVNALEELSTPATLANTGSDGNSNIIVLGNDNFPRIVFYDTGNSNLKYIRCQDKTCTSKVSAVVDNNATMDQYDRSISMKLGSDGFVRIAYYDKVLGALKYAVCNNDDCSSPAVTTVFDPASGKAGKYTALALDSSNNAYILYHRGTGDSSGGTVGLARYVGSGGTGCTSSAWSCNNSLVTPGGNGQDMYMGSDGFLRIVLQSFTSPNSVKYIVCTNPLCTTMSAGSPVTVDTAAGTGVQMVQGKDGFSRMVYTKFGSPNSIKYLQCNNDECTDSTGNILSTDATNWASLSLDASGLAHIAFRTLNSAGLRYAICNNDACSVPKIYSVDSTVDAWHNSIVTDSSNTSYITYASIGGGSGLKYVYTTIQALTDKFAVGDEFLISNMRGTSASYNDVGTYETRYISNIANSTISFTPPLTHSYDGTTQTVLLQRIPQYSTVSIQAGSPTTNGLVGHWKFDENSGTSAADSTGNGLTGTLTNGPGWSANGRYNSALSINGYSNNSVEIGDKSELELSSVTMTAWIYKKGKCNTNLCTIFAKGESGNKGYGLSLKDVGGGFKATVQINDDAQRLLGTTPIAPGRWYHIAGSFDGTTVKVYVNGVLENSAPQTAVPSFGSEAAAIGNQNDNRDLSFNGIIDDVRVYNRALDASEIADIGKVGELTIDSFNESLGLGGLLFFRAKESVTVGSNAYINSSGKGYNGGVFSSSQGPGVGGITYNGRGGEGGGTTTHNGQSGQGGGGGAGKNPYTGGAGTVGGAGGGGGHDASTRAGGGGGGGYGSVGQGGLSYNGGVGNGSPGSGTSGGNGGDGNASGGDNGAGGGGGGTYGAANLEKIMFGSGGGQGGQHDGSDTIGDGGPGGGIIYIASKSISSAGYILNNGNDGGNGITNSAGGGGGSGGAIYLASPSLSLGSSVIKANGGSGGLGALTGGTGGSGRIALYSQNSISGSTSPSYNPGVELGFSSSGTLVSSVLDAGQSSNWGALTYTASTPDNTGVTIKVRTSNNADMNGAADFSTCSGIPSGNGADSSPCVHNGDRYAQYQVTLTTTAQGSTPVLNSIKIEYGNSGEVSSSTKSDPGPNTHENWAFTVNAGAQYVGEVTYITHHDAPGAAALIPNDSAHDPLHVSFSIATPEHLTFADPKIPFPWEQGFNTIGEIYAFKSVSAFNGLPVTTFDKPVTIVVPYNPDLLKGRNLKTMRIIYWDASARRWRLLKDNTIFNSEKNTLVNTTLNFTYFVVGYSKGSSSGVSSSVKAPSIKKKAPTSKPNKKVKSTSNKNPLTQK